MSSVLFVVFFLFRDERSWPRWDSVEAGCCTYFGGEEGDNLCRVSLASNSIACVTVQVSDFIVSPTPSL